MAQVTINKILILLISIFFLSGCADKNAVYKLDNRSITLGKDINNRVNINFTNPLMQRHLERCVFDSYTLLDDNENYGNLFIEYIDISSNCRWNGLSSGFFETSLRYSLKLNSIKTVETFEIDNYTFKTYMINNDSYLSAIYIYKGSTKDVFILDYYGRLYTKVLKTFNPNYINKFLAKKRFIGRYNESLVRKNFIEHYFSVDRSDFGSRIGISISL